MPGQAAPDWPACCMCTHAVTSVQAWSADSYAVTQIEMGIEKSTAAALKAADTASQKATTMTGYTAVQLLCVALSITTRKHAFGAVNPEQSLSCGTCRSGKLGTTINPIFDHSEKVRTLSSTHAQGADQDFVGNSHLSTHPLPLLPWRTLIQMQGSASASSQDTFNAWSSAKNKLQDHSVEQVLPSA